MVFWVWFSWPDVVFAVVAAADQRRMVRLAGLWWLHVVNRFQLWVVFHRVQASWNMRCAMSLLSTTNRKTHVRYRPDQRQTIKLMCDVSGSPCRVSTTLGKNYCSHRWNWKHSLSMYCHQCFIWFYSRSAIIRSPERKGSNTFKSGSSRYVSKAITFRAGNMHARNIPLVVLTDQHNAAGSRDASYWGRLREMNSLPCPWMSEYFRFYNDTPQRGFYAPKYQISFNLIYSILFSFSQIIIISDHKNSWLKKYIRS